MSRLLKRQDAYGHEIFDYWRGQKRVSEIVERDDGYIDLSLGPREYMADYPAWPIYQRQAIRFARGKVLDIGCGAGRCLLYLQKKGLTAVGIDISPLAIRVCRERGAKGALLRSITEIGPDLGRFDTVVMFGNNFGLFGSAARAKRLLRTMARMTTPKARIIAESTDPHQTTRPDHLAYHRRNRRRRRLPGQLHLRIRYRCFITPWFDYLLVSPAEMEQILSGTGWRIHRLFPSADSAYAAVLEKD